MKAFIKFVLSLLVLISIVAFLPTAASADNVPVAHAISVVKALSGDTPPTAERFSFKLTAVDGAPMPASSTVTISGAGTASFGAVQYSEPKDYAYTVSELRGSAANYTYDSTVYTVIVQVVTDDAGRLTATQYVKKSGGKPADGKVTFSNTYTAPKTTPTTDKGSSTGSPKTNDVTNDALLAKIAAVSGAVMLLYIFYWSRRKKQDKQNRS